jgi:hypothetical protein
MPACDSRRTRFATLGFRMPKMLSSLLPHEPLASCDDESTALINASPLAQTWGQLVD